MNENKINSNCLTNVFALWNANEIRKCKEDPRCCKPRTFESFFLNQCFYKKLISTFLSKWHQNVILKHQNNFKCVCTWNERFNCTRFIRTTYHIKNIKLLMNQTLRIKCKSSSARVTKSPRWSVKWLMDCPIKAIVSHLTTIFPW